MSILEADYVVVGAGALGMAFADALVEHSDARVVLVDRRNDPGGHWLDAYPFVRLHQASAFYGVASTLLGGGRLQEDGPERGLQERATAEEIRGYYDSVLARLVATGRVIFLPRHEWTDGRCISLVTGQETEVCGTARVVDAHYLAPAIPAVTPPPFAVGEGARVITVNELADVTDEPSRYVIAGSGKTATDACTWLLQQGVDPGRTTWVRPRDPWMLDRAVIQPDPGTYLGAAADIMEVGATARSADEVFLGLEERGVVMRIDQTVLPTMARTPTLAGWELDLLRSVEDVVRLGHLRAVEPGRLVCDDGTVEIPRDAVVVHCAAQGERHRPLVPIWRPEAITVQPVRSGFPCFGAALTGYVEATVGIDADKNRLCSSSPNADTPTSWLAMQALGGRAEAAYTSDPDLRAWVNTVALNPARVPADLAGTAPVREARARLEASGAAGLARMAVLAGID